MNNCKEAALAFKKYMALAGEIPDNPRMFLEKVIPELDACAARQDAAP